MQLFFYKKMAKTKAQKHEAVKAGEKELKDSKFLVFADFSATSNEDLKKFRRAIRPINAKFVVLKKRLLGVALKNAGIEYNPKQFTGQAGTIFAKGDISEIAQVAYNFSKGKQTFKLLGGLDLTKKESLSGAAVIAIGKLPSREVLLAQVLGGITGPMRKLLIGLNEVGKKKATA